MALPSYKVLLLLPSPKGSLFYDSFNFPFWGIINDGRCRLGKVWAMFRCFSVRGKKGSMEYIMNLPYLREVESVHHMRDFGGYPKGSVLPQG